MLRATFWAGKASGCALQGHPGRMAMLCDFWVGAGPVRPGLSPNSRTGTPVLLAVTMVAVRRGPISAVGARERPPEGSRMGLSVRLFGEMALGAPHPAGGPTFLNFLFDIIIKIFRFALPVYIL